MNSAATATPTSTAAFRLSEADIGVLSRVNRFQYLTAHQLTRLAFPAYRDGDRYARRRLHRLTEAGLLLRLRALPMPRFGSAPQVFTLARPGYTLLSGLGIPTPAYFRPAEEHRKAENFPFMHHTLAVVDTLITIERACQSLGFPTPAPADRTGTQARAGAGARAARKPGGRDCAGCARDSGCVGADCRRRVLALLRGVGA